MPVSYTHLDVYKRQQPELWANNSWILHHDNTLHYQFVCFWQETNTVIVQSPYSPAMAPCDFFLFPKTKITVKGHFAKQIKARLLSDLWAIPKPSDSIVFSMYCKRKINF